jgi:hypothetical protein
MRFNAEMRISFQTDLTAMIAELDYRITAVAINFAIMSSNLNS